MRITTLVGLALLSACVRPTLPDPVAPRDPSIVNASFGKTWDAVIDAFAERNISIQTLDRSSGLIVPSGATYPPGRTDREVLEFADCGRLGSVPYLPSSVKYNVVVRGDSAKSTVHVRAFFESLSPSVSCVSTGTWEASVEAAIAARAEGKAVSAATTSSSSVPCSENDRTKVGGGDIAAWVSIPGDGGQCGAPIRCVYSGKAAYMSPADAISKCRSDAYKESEKKRRG